MNSVSASRVLLQASKLGMNRAFASGRNQGVVRLMATMTPPPYKKDDRRKIHSTPAAKADAVAASTEAEPSVSKSSPKTIADRFVATAEVTVSKIFPAGFGWQSSSIIA